MSCGGGSKTDVGLAQVRVFEMLSFLGLCYFVKFCCQRAMLLAHSVAVMLEKKENSGEDTGRTSEGVIEFGGSPGIWHAWPDPGLGTSGRLSVRARRILEMS